MTRFYRYDFPPNLATLETNQSVLTTGVAGPYLAKLSRRCKVQKLLSVGANIWAKGINTIESVKLLGGATTPLPPL